MADFLKTLSETDVEARLSMPTIWFKKHLFPRFGGECKLDLLVKDLSEDVWSFGISIRTKGSHFKPVLSKGWRKFARAKALKPGNKIVFVMENDPVTGTQYKIEVIKVIKLFGKNIEGRV